MVLANAGEVRGTVPLPFQQAATAPAKKYFGKISGKVDPAPPLIAGVWLTNDQLRAPSGPNTVTLNQENYQFSSFLVIIPVGSSVLFPNRDRDYHNIYSLSRTKPFDLGRYKQSEAPAPIVFEKPGFVSLHCEIHDHMKSNIIVVDSPYYTLTDSSGSFSLKSIPPGSYTLHAQYTRKSSWKIPIKVERGKITNVSFPKP